MCKTVNNINYVKSLTNTEDIFASVFIEIDKKKFNSNTNIIVGLIYKPQILQENSSMKN